MTKKYRFFYLTLLALVAPMAKAELAFATAERISAPQEYLLDGVVEASQQSTLSAEVSGRIIEINFDVDDFVQQGEVIIRIRDNEYRARLQKAKATLAEAQAAYKDAQREFKRIQGLLKNKAVSRADYDKANANVDATRARVAASQASISETQDQLDNTVVRAPYSGIVSRRHVELGESTSIGQAIMSGFALGELRVKVDVPQSIINAVRQYQSARVLLANNDIAIDAGQFTIFPYADALNHAFRVRIELPKTDLAIFPGMLVKVSFIVGLSERLMIPSEAVVRRSEVMGVYVIDKNTQRLSFRQIRTGIINLDQVEITAGLEAGERVALNPVEAGIRLKENWNSKQ